MHCYKMHCFLRYQTNIDRFNIDVNYEYIHAPFVYKALPCLCFSNSLLSPTFSKHGIIVIVKQSHTTTCPFPCHRHELGWFDQYWTMMPLGETTNYTATLVIALCQPLFWDWGTSYNWLESGTDHNDDGL